MEKTIRRLMFLALGLALVLGIIAQTTATASAATYADVSASTYTIASKSNEKFLLDVYGSTSKSGSNVQVYQNASNTTQQFVFTKTSGGWYSISPRSNTALALNQYSNRPVHGTNANVWKVNTTDKTQGWYLQQVGNYFVILSAYNPNLALTVQTTPKNLVNVRMENYTGKDAQLWRLTPVSSSSSTTTTLVFPVNNGMIAYYYGYTKEYGGTHNGIDIHASTDSGVYCAMAGKIVAIANQCSHWNYGGPCSHWKTYGNYIQILGDDGRYYYYGHLKLNSISVKVGDRVTAGAKLAEIGSSGWSTGPHLHFEVRSASGTVLNVNPVSGNYKYLGNTFSYKNGPYY